MYKNIVNFLVLILFLANFASAINISEKDEIINQVYKKYNLDESMKSQIDFEIFNKLKEIDTIEFNDKKFEKIIEQIYLEINSSLNYTNDVKVNISKPENGREKNITKNNKYIIVFDEEGLIDIEMKKNPDENKLNLLSIKKADNKEVNKNLKEELLKKHETKKNYILAKLGNNKINTMSKNSQNNKVREFTKIFSGIAVEIYDKKILDEINKSENVTIIPDISVHPLVKKETRDLLNIDNIWNGALGNLGLTGNGVTVAVLDTGIDYTHEDFGSCTTITNCDKFVDYYDFVNNDLDPMDDNGHGTHVASTIASQNANENLKGIAPDAKLMAYKVLGTESTWSDLLAGMERAVDPNNDGNYDDMADIVSMSLGGPIDDSNDFYNLELDRLSQYGVIFVVAAGNDGSNLYTINTPGAAREAITVGASFKELENYSLEQGYIDKIADFSSRGPTKQGIIKPDIIAPGVYICAAKGNGLYNDKTLCIDDKHVEVSGTSMATPIVSGVIALLKEKNQSLNSTQVKAILRNSAKDIGYNPLIQGWGRIDPLKALELNGESCIVEFKNFNGFTDSHIISLNAYIDCPDFNNYEVQIIPFENKDNLSSNYTTVYTGNQEGDVYLNLTTSLINNSAIVKIIAYDNNPIYSNYDMVLANPWDFYINLDSLPTSANIFETINISGYARNYGYKDAVNVTMELFRSNCIGEYEFVNSINMDVDRYIFNEFIFENVTLDKTGDMCFKVEVKDYVNIYGYGWANSESIYVNGIDSRFELNNINIEGKKIDEKLISGEEYNFSIDIENVGSLSGSTQILMDLRSPYTKSENFACDIWNRKINTTLNSMETKTIKFESIKIDDENKWLYFKTESENATDDDYTKYLDILKIKDYEDYDLYTNYIFSDYNINELFNISGTITNLWKNDTTVNLSLFYENENGTQIYLSSKDYNIFSGEEIEFIFEDISGFKELEYNKFLVKAFSKINNRIISEDSTFVYIAGKESENEDIIDLGVIIDYSLIGSKYNGEYIIGEDYIMRGYVMNYMSNTYDYILNIYEAKSYSDDYVLVDSRNLSTQGNSIEEFSYKFKLNETQENRYYLKAEIVDKNTNKTLDYDTWNGRFPYIKNKSKSEVTSLAIEGETIGYYNLIKNNKYNFTFHIENFGSENDIVNMNIYSSDNDCNIEENYVLLKDESFNLSGFETTAKTVENISTNSSKFCLKVVLNNTENIDKYNKEYTLIGEEPDYSIGNGFGNNPMIMHNKSSNYIIDYENYGLNTQNHNITAYFLKNNDTIILSEINKNFTLPEYGINVENFGSEKESIIVDLVNISEYGYDKIIKINENKFVKYKNNDTSIIFDFYKPYYNKTIINDLTLTCGKDNYLEIEIDPQDIYEDIEYYLEIVSENDSNIFDNFYNDKIEVITEDKYLTGYVYPDLDYKLLGYNLKDGKEIENYVYLFNKLNKKVYPTIQVFSTEIGKRTILSNLSEKKTNFIIGNYTNSTFNISNFKLDINYNIYDNLIENLSLKYKNITYSLNPNTTKFSTKIDDIFIEFEHITNDNVSITIDKLNKITEKEFTLNPEKLEKYNLAFLINKTGNYKLLFFEKNSFNILENKSNHAIKNYVEPLNTYNLCIYDGEFYDRNKNGIEDSCEADLDGNGVEDVQEAKVPGKVIGNESLIKTKLNLSIEIGNFTNFNFTNLSGKKKIKIKNKLLNKSIVEFEFNFNKSSFYVPNVSIDMNKTNENKSYLIVRGIELEENTTKTVRFERVTNTDKVCIKDAEVENISQLTSNCSGESEYLLTCDGNISYNQYSCMLNGSEFIVSGLNHSAVVEFEEVETSSPVNGGGGGSPSGGGGGGGGSSSGGYVPPTTMTNEVKNKVKIGEINESFNIMVNGIYATDREFEGLNKVILKDRNLGKNVVEFNFNFSKKELDLSNAKVIVNSNPDKNFVIVKGIELEDNNTKTIRMQSVLDSNEICIKDSEISNESEISETCMFENEYIIKCDGQNYFGYSCVVESDYYVISGLKHSGAYEMEPVNSNMPESKESEPLTANNENNPLENINKSVAPVDFGKVSEGNDFPWGIVIVGVVVVIIMIVGLLVFLTKNSKGYESPYHSRTYNEQYHMQIRDYVRRYKRDYKKEAIRNALEKAGTPDELINRVFKEEGL